MPRVKANTMSEQVTVIGAGLAGSEAAWQLAEQGLTVDLVEMKPHQHTPAQITDEPAELVCSNSLRSTNILNAVGLLKEEMKRLGSLVIHAATQARVPAGDALAVDRRKFSGIISEKLSNHPRITIRHEIIENLPQENHPTIVATGPLTADKLASDILRHTGNQGLYFHDALAPIVSGNTIDQRKIFAASRYGKGDGNDYLNCPMDEPTYENFWQALVNAESVPFAAFEEPKYFNGCMPIEEVAKSGKDALRFGALKPVGLTHPETRQRFFAVVQLRKEDLDGQAYNLVGFQTKLKHGAQKEILRLIPGLENAEFLRLGSMHRNTFLDSPQLLDIRMRLYNKPHIRFAGQITGVEGYVESAAHGLITALLVAADLKGTLIPPPPRTTALGGLYRHVTGESKIPGRPFEPQNVNWSMMPPVGGSQKGDHKVTRVKRANVDFEKWANESRIKLLSRSLDIDDLQTTFAGA